MSSSFSGPAKEISPAVEVFFKDQSDALSVETVSSEISVVGLIVHLDGHASAGEEQVADVEIADETGCSIGIVAIAELTIDEQTVVEQTPAEGSFILGVVPSLVACRDVGSKVPVRVVDNGA